MKDDEISRVHSPNYDKDRRPLILSYALDYEQQWREERGAAIEAEVMRALIQASDRVLGGKLALKEVKESLNRDRAEGEKFSGKSVRGFLTSLGFKKTRTSAGDAAIIFDSHILKSRARQFGLLDELKQAEEQRPPTAERLDEGDVTVEWLINLDTGDVNQPNQPIFERLLGKGKKFSKGQHNTIDLETAKALSMMGAVKVLRG